MSSRVGADTVRYAYPEPSIAAGAGSSHCRATGDEEVCITCGDVAVPLEVIGLDEARGLALCQDEQGRRETVETALVLPVAVGDHLLVHAGTAIAHVDDPAPPPQGAARGDAVMEGSAMPGREAEDMHDVAGGSA
jgi:hydrogenase assembly chaperone HypC/HupF